MYEKSPLNIILKGESFPPKIDLTIPTMRHCQNLPKMGLCFTSVTNKLRFVLLTDYVDDIWIASFWQVSWRVPVGITGHLSHTSNREGLLMYIEFPCRTWLEEMFQLMIIKKLKNAIAFKRKVPFELFYLSLVYFSFIIHIVLRKSQPHRGPVPFSM